jgi:hypothetical protein
MASTQTGTSSASEMYKHQPLDFNKHQIRLLKLRDSSERTMDYRLETFDFESAPSYVALSYTWGEEHPTGPISIDGKAFEIRINLLNFLTTYQTDEYLWIDQICIDQSNSEERNNQVRLMWKIYTKCDCVLVWLRDESTCIPSTRQAALDFNNGVESYLERGYREDSSSDNKRAFNRPTLSLLHNSYFDRLWIVQELLLNEYICILVEGNVWILWESLRAKNEELRDEIQKIMPSTWYMVHVQDSQFPSACYIDTIPWSYITFTISVFCSKRCMDPRDKVYGLMALIHPSSQIEIDYAKSVHRVFLDAIMSMIREYWYMRHIPPEDGNKRFKLMWTTRESAISSRYLAKAMGFTDMETYGLGSFLGCIWGRVVLHEAATKSHGHEVDVETHCITAVGYETETIQPFRNELLAATCDRWWYEFEGKRYFHNCKEWSGEAELQEYTV